MFGSGALRPAIDARLPFIRRTAIAAAILLTVIFCAIRLLDIYPWNDRIFDLWAYWSTRSGLDYTHARPGDPGAYLYSPAFAHLIAPLTALPMPVFAAIWTAMLVGILGWLSGWRALFIGLLPPVVMSIAIGQTDLLMAAAIVIGFRWPAAWVLPIVTKATPVVGLLWFAARREWGSLQVALGATVAVAAVSYAVDPAAWAGWLGMVLRMEFPTAQHGIYLPIPVSVRLPLVAILVIWGARSNRRWVLPVAIALALPTVWINSPTIIVGALPLVAAGAMTPAGRWLRGRPLGLVALARQRLRRLGRRTGTMPG